MKLCHRIKKHNKHCFKNIADCICQVTALREYQGEPLKRTNEQAAITC